MIDVLSSRRALHQPPCARGGRRLAHRAAVTRASSNKKEGEGVDALSLSPLQLGIVGGLLGTVFVGALFLQGFELDDVFALPGGTVVTPGDVLGAALWSTSLFFASPAQSLLLFLGRIDAERPSDTSLRFLGTLAGLDVDAASYEAPSALRAANVALYVAGGVAIAASLNVALGGEATWSVATGLGSCAAAGVYEIGRPQRLSATQQVALESEWQDFKAFADARLERRGRCHTSDVEKAYKAYSAAYRKRVSQGDGVNAANDVDLRNFVANWCPSAERTSGGFIKGVSVRAAPVAPRVE